MNKEEKIREMVKFSTDPLSFLRYVRIQEPGELALRYELWPHLVEFYRALERFKFIDVIKAKQVGISWSLAITALREVMTIPGWSVLEISKGMIEAQELLAKSRVVYENLPEWIKEIPEYREPRPNSSEQFGFERLGSIIQAFPSTESSGIGKTVGRVIHDEADFHEFYLTNLGHTKATVADSPERRLVAVSTIDTSKQDSDFQRHWKAAEGSGYPEAGSNNFKALFYGVFSRPDRDEQFYQQLVRENEQTPWVVKRNYPRTPEEALSPIAATSCFKKSVLEQMWNNSIEPEVRQNSIYILRPPAVGTQYTAGADVGGGGGLDYSVLTIVGRWGLMSEVAAVIYSNTIGTDVFAFEVDKLCREYFNPLLVVDNIGIGRAVIDKLVQLGYPNLYFSELERRKKNISRREAGWSLTRPNKRELLVKLVERLNNGSLVTRFKPMIKELMEYQWVQDYPKPTGRTHGDTVISLMLASGVLDRLKQPEEAHMFVRGRKIW